MKTFTLSTAILLFAAASLIAQQPQTSSQQQKPAEKKTDSKAQSAKPQSESKTTGTQQDKTQPGSDKNQQAPRQYTYFVQATHDPGQCNDVAKELKAKSENNLTKFWFGCKSGDHTIYGFTRGTDEANVKSTLPDIVVSKMKIVKVDRNMPSSTRTTGQEKGNQPTDPKAKDQNQNQNKEKESDKANPKK